MPSSAIDSLLQIVTPRTSDAPLRAGEGGGSFGPALKQALAGDKPEAAAAPQTATNRAAELPPAEQDNSRAVEDDSPHDAEDEQALAEAAEESVDETSAVDEVAEDAVEISETAEAAAGVAGQQSAEPSARLKPAKHDAELALAAAGDDAKTPAPSESADADAAEEETSETATPLKKLGKPVLTAAIEESPSKRARSDKEDDGQKTAGRRAEKGDSKSAIRPATASELEPSSDETVATAEEATNKPETNRRSSELASDAKREADSPTTSPHENWKQSAGPHAPAASMDAAAIATELPEATAGDESDSFTDKAGAKPLVADNAAPPQGSRGSASLDRVTAPRAVHPASPSADADGGLQVDRARFIGRVEGAVRAAHQRDGRVQVRLSPPELGSLRIEITVQQGVLHAQIEAETPAARNLLLDNLPALRERLAQQDMRVEKFDVDVRRDGGGQSGGNGAQDRQADQPAWRDGDRSDRPGLNRQATAARAPRAAPAARISDAELDVRI